MGLQCRRSFPKLSRGFTIIETLVVTCVLVSLMSLGSRYITQNAERTVNQITAQQLRQITKAAQNYVQDHHQQFKDNPSETLTCQYLVDRGYLPSKFSNTNNYSQSYHFIVVQDKGLLQLLMTTEDGNPISEPSLRQIAALAGSSAGYASMSHQDTIVGHQESWKLEGIPIKKGHLASLTIVNEKEIMNASTFLRGTKIAGDPEYYRMESGLEIADNNKISYGKNGFQLSKTDFSITDDKGSFIQISGGGNKLFKITHPNTGGQEMRLWSNVLELENKKNGSKILMENREKIGINIERDGNSSRLTDKEFFIKNKSNESIIYPGLINAYAKGSVASLSVSAPWEDKAASMNILKGWSQKSELTAHWIRIPVYMYEHGHFGSGTFVAQQICKSHNASSPEFTVPIGNGRIFMISEELSQKLNLFLCQESTPHIILTRPLNPGE